MSVIRKAGNCVMWSDVMEVSNNKQGDDVNDVVEAHATEYIEPERY